MTTYQSIVAGMLVTETCSLDKLKASIEEYSRVIIREEARAADTRPAAVAALLERYRTRRNELRNIYARRLCAER